MVGTLVTKTSHNMYGIAQFYLYTRIRVHALLLDKIFKLFVTCMQALKSVLTSLKHFACQVLLCREHSVQCTLVKCQLDAMCCCVQLTYYINHAVKTIKPPLFTVAVL